MGPQKWHRWKERGRFTLERLKFEVLGVLNGPGEARKTHNFKGIYEGGQVPSTLVLSLFSQQR